MIILFLVTQKANRVAAKAAHKKKRATEREENVLSEFTKNNVTYSTGKIKK